MGLTIHYKLSVTKYLASAVVRELADRTALYARKIGCAEVSEVVHATDDEKSAPLFFHVGKPEDGCFGHVAPKRGWLVGFGRAKVARAPRLVCAGIQASFRFALGRCPP